MREDGLDPLLMEALEWFVRLKDDQATMAERAEFELWLRRDQAHVAAWAHAEALWTRLDVAQPEFDRIRRSQVSAPRRAMLLGGLLLAGGVGSLAISRSGALRPGYETGIGERRRFALGDGSTVELGSYSALSATFTPSLRHITLHRGEGFFDVAYDPQRPFLVRAAEGGTRAFGAKFDVKYVDDRVTVAAQNHAVTVKLRNSAGIRIGPDWQLSYDATGLGQPNPVDWQIVDAWRHDRIVFQNVPLKVVLSELDRYRPGRIVIMSKGIGTIPVTAVFNTSEAPAALQTIASTLPIRVVYATRYLSLVFAA